MPAIPHAYSSYYGRYAHTLHTEKFIKGIRTKSKNHKLAFFLSRAEDARHLYPWEAAGLAFSYSLTTSGYVCEWGGGEAHTSYPYIFKRNSKYKSSFFLLPPLSIKKRFLRQNLMSCFTYQFNTLVWRYSLAHWMNSYLARIALKPQLFSYTGLHSWMCRLSWCKTLSSFPTYTFR